MFSATIFLLSLEALKGESLERPENVSSALKPENARPMPGDIT
jgi:hypothetical protein